jgi:autotransporter-associated beta strand protein
MKPRSLLSSASVAAVLLVSQAAQAATYTWDGDTSEYWNNAANWDASPVSDNITVLTFNVAGTSKPNVTNNDIAGTFILNSMLFGKSMTLSGNKIQFDGAAPTLNIAPSVALVINNDLNFAAGTTLASTVTTANTSTVEFKGLLSGSTLTYVNSHSTPNLTIKFSGSSGNTLNGFTWGNTVASKASGKVQINMNDPFGGTGTSFRLDNSASTFYVEGIGSTSAAPRSIASAIYLRGNVTFSGTSMDFQGAYSQYSSPTRTITNNLTSGETLTLASGSTFSLAAPLILGGATDSLTVIPGVVSGANFFSRTSALTLRLTGLNTYTASTTVAMGALEFNSVENKSATPLASALGKPVANGTAEVIQLGGTTNAGALKYIGTVAGGHSSDRPLNLAGTTGGGTLDASGTGTISFLGGVTATGLGNKTLILTGTNTGANTLGGAIVNSTGYATSLSKSGGGTWAITGTNTYTGTTAVSNGKLLVNNTSGSGTGSGDVTVASGATLGGTGSLTGAVTVTGGTLSPGASVESFSTGAVTLAGGTFEYETNHRALPAAAGDLLIANGNLTLTGTVNLTLTDLALPTGAFTANSTTLTLIQYAGTWNGGFFTYNTNELTNNESFEDTYGNNWKITYNATSGGSNFATELLGGGSFVTLSNLTAVPEPGSLFAIGCLIGSGALLRSRRGSRRRAA